MFPARYLLVRPGPDAHTGEHPSWRYTAVLGWAGMRGVVTLAAAFVIPLDVPEREVLVLIALSVTAGTLFLQGLSLPWLVRRLRLPGPDPREDALARAALFQQASAAGRAWLEDEAETSAGDDPHGTVAALRRRAEQRDFAAWERVGSNDPDVETPSEAYARLRRAMLQAERERILEVRSSGRVPHEVVEDVLAALDVEESMLDDHHARHDLLKADQAEREVVPMSGATGALEACAHLREAPAPPAQVTRECRGVRGDGRARLGAPAQLPGLRIRRLLRLLPAPARQRALRGERAPGDGLGGAGGELAMVLRGQHARVSPLGWST